MKKHLIIARSAALIFALSPLTGCQHKDVAEDVDRHLLLAKTYMSQGQLRSSIIESKNALQLQPNSVKALTRIGKVMTLAGDMNNAEKQFAHALTFKPDDKELLYLLAESQIKLNKAEASLITLQKLAEEEKNTALYQQLLGDIYYIEQNNPPAEAAYRKSLNTEPEHHASMLGIARIKLSQGKTIEAEKWLEDASKTAPEDVELLLFKGQLSLNQGKPNVAEAHFSEALTWLTRLDLMSAQKYRGLDGMVKSLIAQGRTTEALRYSEVLASSPQGRLQSEVKDAISAYESGDFESAEQAFESILEQAPMHNLSTSALGAIKFTKGEFEEAEQYLEAALEGSDQVPAESYKLLAVTQIRLNKNIQAKTIIDQGIKTYPENADLITLKGLSLAQENNLDDAEKLFNQALTIEPDNLGAHLSLATLHLSLKNFNKARNSFEQAATIEPNNFVALRGWIKSLNATKTLKTEIKKLEQFANNHPESFAPFTAIGISYLGLGESEKAIEYGLKAKQINASHPYITKLLAASYYQIAKDFAEQKQYSQALNNIKSSQGYQDSFLPSIALEINILTITQGPDTALQVAEKQIAKYPKQHFGHEIKGDLLATTEKFETAKIAYQNAWNLTQNRILGMKLFQVNQKIADEEPAKHLEDWSQSLTSSDSASNEKKEESLVALSFAYQALGQSKQAKETYETLLNYNSENPIYLNNLAWLLHELKDDKALDLAAKAYNLKPDAPEIADTYGWILAQSGDKQGGVEVLKKAHEAWPDHPEIKAHLESAQQ